MKITKRYLKEIIKEELKEAEGFQQNIGGGSRENAQKLVQIQNSINYVRDALVRAQEKTNPDKSTKNMVQIPQPILNVILLKLDAATNAAINVEAK